MVVDCAADIVFFQMSHQKIRPICRTTSNLDGFYDLLLLGYDWQIYWDRRL